MVVLKVLGKMLLVVGMFIGSVIIIKLIADTFARFVLWTGEIFGMGYK